MIIKSFVAENSSKAIKRIRLEMGGEAIVLKTRNVIDSTGNSRVEVTACLDKPSVAQSSVLLESPRPELKEIAQEIVPVMPTSKEAKTKISASDEITEEIILDFTPIEAKQGISASDEITEEIILDCTPTDDSRAAEQAAAHAFNSELNSRIENIETKLNRIFTQLLSLSGKSGLSVAQDNLSRALQESDFPDEFIDSIISDIDEAGISDENFSKEASKILTMRLSAMMLPSLSIKAPGKVMFIGPAASGKSSVLSKMAALLISTQKETVKLMTLDDMKLGAYDELNTCADFLGIETIEKNEIKKSALSSNDKSIWLIDTPAILKNRESIGKIKEAIKTVKPDFIFAVFSAVTRTADIKEFSRIIKSVNPTHLIITMTDLTDCLGSLAQAAITTGAKIAFVTDRPGGRPMLNSPEPALYASRLMNSGENNE